MKKRGRRSGAMKSFRFDSGMQLHIADFVPSEAVRQRFETENPVFRFYFHILAGGHWELKSPYRSPSQKIVPHSNSFSFVLFYPEIEGKMVLPKKSRQFHISLYITPSQLNRYLGGRLKQLPKALVEISQGCVDRGFSHQGSFSEIMNLSIQHLLDCPYTGLMKELYMENKAIELIVHKLAQTLTTNDKEKMPLKIDFNETDRIHRAGEILCRDLESPPRLSDLAHAVGTNHCRLNAGFRKIFGTTVFGYLRQRRLIEAKRLIEEDQMSVTEAAFSVGYNSISSFSKAFSKYFGIQPVMCRKRRIISI